MSKRTFAIQQLRAHAKELRAAGLHAARQITTRYYKGSHDREQTWSKAARDTLSRARALDDIADRMADR